MIYPMQDSKEFPKLGENQQAINRHICQIQLEGEG